MAILNVLLRSKLRFGVFALFLLMAPLQALAGERHLTILHFNDLHGHLEGDADGGGAARIATIVRGIEEKNRATGQETLVFFGGDAFTGTLISGEFEGAAEFDFFDALPIDAMVIGNHEFDYGVQRFLELEKEASFPILSANTFVKEGGERFAKPCAVFGDVAVIGITTQETRTSTLPENVAGLKFTDPAAEAKRAMKLKECRAPISIALTHQGVRADVALAEKVRGLAAVVGGHDHVSPAQYCRVVKEVPVCQTPANGRYVGRIDLTIDGRKAQLASYELIPVSADVPEDGKIAALVKTYSSKIAGRFNRVVGKANEDLPYRGKGQTRLGSIVAEAMRSAAKAEIAFINTSGLRAPLKAGPIKLKDLAEVMPFRNHVVVMELSGFEIEKVLAHAISRRGEGGLQVAGISFEVEGKKPVDIRINGKALEPGTVYSAATVDFLASGGSGFSMLKKAKLKKATGILVRDATAKYIEEKRVIP